MEDQEHVQRLACMAALRDMVSKGYVNICTIDKVCDTLGLSGKSTPAYRTLSLLHCMDFSKMPDELRQQIPALLYECLGVDPFEKPAPVVQVVPRKKLFGLIG